MTGIEVSHKTRHSSKSNKLTNVKPMRGRTGNITIQKGKFIISESKSSRLLFIMDETNPFEIDKCEYKNGALVSDELVLFNCSSSG